MEFFDVINNRRSMRAYKPSPVEKEKLEAVLEAARQAPTACNLQAFKVLVIPTEGHEEELQKIYPKTWFTQAPYILGVCSIPGGCWVRRDQRSYGEVDASIIMDHIILAATAQGLGTCWVGAFDYEKAKEVLALDPSYDPIAFTPIGYSSDTPREKKRKPIEELVEYIAFKEIQR
ncbi:MAG: nitroreductase [Clostridiales bacterium]|nr:nitroreductase [Clostridiales bacterium]